MGLLVIASINSYDLRFSTILADRREQKSNCLL